MNAKLRILLWVGILIFLMPLFGLPTSWKNVASIIFGALVVYLVFRIRHIHKKALFELRQKSQPDLQPELEHTPQAQESIHA